MAVPKLRFPNFKREWHETPLGNVVKPNIIETDKPDKDYIRLGLRSHCKGTFHQAVKIEDILEADKMFIVPKNNLIVNITFAWEQAIAITDENDEGKIVSGRFPTFAFQDGHLPQFYKFILPSKRLKYNIGLASPGGAGRNRVLNKKDFLRIKIGTTDIEEQQKIADFLTTFDKRITAQQNIIADLEETKKGLLQKIFSQEIRFKDDNGQDYPDWEEIVLGKCIKFYNGDRSDKYPKSSEIRNNGIPFINAGDLVDGKVSENKLQYISEKKYKSLGGAKLEVGDIIYCLRGSIGKNALYDKKYGTLASSLVALRCEKGINNSFLYQIINSEVFVHKIRIYSTGLAQPNLAASDLKKMKLCIPKRNEQDKIAKFLSSFDKKITAEKQILSDLQEMKKGLLQQMFV